MKWKVKKVNGRWTVFQPLKGRELEPRYWPYCSYRSFDQAIVAATNLYNWAKS